MYVVDVLSFPFGFNSNGRPRVVDQASDECLLQRTAAFIQTRTGELPLAPEYGLDDPTLRPIYEQEIIAGLAVFHPEIQVNDIAIYQENDVALIVDLDITNTVEADEETDLIDRRVIIDA